MTSHFQLEDSGRSYLRSFVFQEHLHHFLAVQFPLLRSPGWLQFVLRRSLFPQTCTIPHQCWICPEGFLNRAHYQFAYLRQKGEINMQTNIFPAEVLVKVM